MSRRWRPQRKLRPLPWNWRSRIEIILEDGCIPGYFSGQGNPLLIDRRGRVADGPLRFVLIFRKGKTPVGLSRHIGFLAVDHKKPYWVLESLIWKERFRKRGLGTLLYVHALGCLGQLTTNYGSCSEDAKGLWRSLAQKYPHTTDFFKSRLTITHPLALVGET